MNSPPPTRERLMINLPKAPIDIFRSFKLDSIKKFIDNGRDINDQDPEDGNTLLIEAVSRGKEDIVEYLINEGANLKIINNEGETALTSYVKAIYKTDKLEQIVQMLLESGAWLLPDLNGKMPSEVADEFYEYLKSTMESNNNNDRSSINENFRLNYGMNSSMNSHLRNEMNRNAAAYNAEITRKEILKREKDDKESIAWRASVGLPPSEREADGYNGDIIRHGKNIRDLILLYTDKRVKKINLASMSSRGTNTIFIDESIPVYDLKKLIVFFLKFDFKFDILVPSLGNRKMEDDHLVSDYGLRNESKLIISPKILSGYRGGRTRRSKRRNKKTRRN